MIERVAPAQVSPGWVPDLVDAAARRDDLLLVDLPDPCGIG
ncbi:MULTISPECIES: hypothetical protein [Streptomyces]|nr:hypothetical protein [Streptomyces ruber]